MLKNRTILLIVLFAALSTFCYGIVHLLVLRFKTGDVYAPYSSLRSDPLGTRVLFESLARLNDLAVRRNYEKTSQLGSGRDTTFFYLGDNARSWEFVEEDLMESFEKIANDGGRLVFSFMPVIYPPDEKNRSTSPSDTPPKQAPQKNTTKPTVDKTANPQPSEGQGADQNKISGSKQSGGADPPKKQPRDAGRSASLQQRWGIRFGYQPQGASKPEKAMAASESAGGVQLPPVSWHTLLYFENLQPPWSVIYTLNDRPVIVERTMGQGSIVITADSFFVSNEALRVDRNPALLTWLIGPNSQVVFDEYHLGIRKTEGVASLIRTYRLHWFFMGVAVLAALLVWKNSSHFVPPPGHGPDFRQASFVADRDHTQGLTSLLRRNIAVKDILTVCVTEWKKVADKGPNIAPETISKIESLLERPESSSKKDRDPVAGYRKICAILSEGKKL